MSWRRWPSLSTALAVATGVFAGVPSHAAPLAPRSGSAAADLDTRIADVAAQYGLRPVKPATPAVEIALPDLTGKKTHLSDFSGRWVLLTFLASWCGPCATEMPALAALARARQGKVTVLGVAIESDRDAVAAFVQKYGAAFPVLIDAQGKTAATYHAGSIPLSYLIRPDGRVAGLSRGARDWTKAADLIDAVNAIMPASSEPSASYVQADTVELPQTLTPPTALVILPSAPPEAGALFSIDVRVTWAGTLDDYVLLPPVAELPAGLEERRVSARSSSANGRAVIDYSLELAAAQPGTFAIDPIELRYTPRGENGVLTAQVRGPTVEVHAARFWGLTAKRWAIAGGGAGVLGAGIIFGRRRLNRRQRRAAAGSDVFEPRELRQLLSAARAARARGDVAGGLDTLLRLHRALGETPPPELGEAVQAARYGGIAPAPHLLDIWERRAGRLVAERVPDADAEALRELGVVNDERRKP